MATTGLEVRLREGRERAEVGRFTRTLDEIVLALKEIDRVYLQRGTRATWILTDLNHDGDDMVVRLEARPSSRKRPTDDMLVPVRAFVEGAARLNEVAEVPRLFSTTTVERVAELAEPQRGVQEVTLALYNGKVGQAVSLSGAVREHAREAVRTHEISYGSVTGILDSLAADHRKRGTTRVTIYDPSQRLAITGNIAESMAEDLRLLWRHRVLAGGKVRRNQRGQVIRIEIDRIERMPEDNSGRPDTDDLLGVAPNWLGGQDVDEYLRRLRG